MNSIKKYRVTIEEVTEVEETATVWRDPETDTDYVHLYNIEETVKSRLLRRQKPLGSFEKNYEEVFKQEIEGLDPKGVINFINK